MKKLISLLLCVMLLSGAALAYDGAAPISDETATISVLTTNSASLTYDFDGMMWFQEVLKRANVVLDMEILDSSTYSDSVKPRLAAAVDLPDLINVPGSDADMSYVNAGLFADLTDLYETLGFNLQKQFETHADLEGSLTTPDGKKYYVPYVYTTDSNMRCLMINEPMVEAVGMKLEDIVTLDDFTEFLYKVKESDANGNGDDTDEVPLFSRSGMIGLWGMVWGLDLNDGGGYQVEDDGAVICTFTDSRYKDFLTWANQLYTDGILYNEYATANYDVQASLFASNQMASMIHFISNCTGYSQNINPDWQFNVDEPIMKAVVLEGPTGEKNVYGRGSFGGAFGINADCEQIETVFAFCDYLQSEEVGVLTWYGIEGVDYNIVDGEYVFESVYLDNKDNYLNLMGYNCGALPSYQLDYMTKQCNQVRQMAKDLAPYVMNPTNVFSYKLDSENEIINAYAADLKTYMDENQTAFIMGTRSLDEFDAYVDTLNAMGLQDVIAVYQAIADRNAGK